MSCIIELSVNVIILLSWFACKAPEQLSEMQKYCLWFFLNVQVKIETACFMAQE